MAFDWNVYTGNLGWLPGRTLYLTRHGSHSYGTSLPTSDLDIRGVCIAPKETYLGFGQGFEQATQKEPDLVVFELRKFLGLACECNPNVLELLYTDPSDHLLVTPAWERLVEHRDAFLSKKAQHTFSGYALAQLKRINIHYAWLKNPILHAPMRADFGLPEKPVIPSDQMAAAQAAIRKQLDRWSLKEMDLDPATIQAVLDNTEKALMEMTGWAWQEKNIQLETAAARHLGFSTNFIEVLGQERRFDAAMRNYANYLTWQRERNPARAALEAKYGFDTKHAMHLVRLLRMCREILTEGVVRVRRPDAEELLAIRAGAWTYEQLIEWAAAEDKALKQAAEASKLPWSADKKRVNQICVELVGASF